jgi:hypothetical protein
MTYLTWRTTPPGTSKHGQTLSRRGRPVKALPSHRERRDGQREKKKEEEKKSLGVINRNEDGAMELFDVENTEAFVDWGFVNVRCEWKVWCMK